MMWLTSELFIFIAVMQLKTTLGFQENTFISNSNSISCSRNSTIRIVGLNLEQYSTSCPEYKQCNLTEEEANTIKKRCNKETACTISTIIPNSCLFNDYGHVSISYSCTEIVNSSCTFENGNCGWTVGSYTEYRWKIRFGQSSEEDTGPDRDHTSASEYGYFAYTKSSWGSKENDESSIRTGLIVPSTKQCLTFWYHMYGRDINTLTVFQLRNNHNITLWKKSGNKGNKWHFQSLSLNDIGPYHIMFRATRGNGRKSEIAIDDISITNNDCKKATSIDCNFEADTCGWATGHETYKWKTWYSSKSSSYTGPDVDHTLCTNFGHYMFLKATLNTPNRQKSNLTSAIVSPDEDACFTFWYHMHDMYEHGMSTLNVYLESKMESRITWSITGNRKDRWWLASIAIYTPKPYKIIFEGLFSNTSTGSIALDDIALLSGSCKEASRLDSNFETELYNWNVEQESGKTWTVISGKTPSPNTGPKVDHTYGFHNGHYIYLEATDKMNGQKSNLTSETVSPDGVACFTFWFHMYGDGTGMLNLYLVSENMTIKLWSRSGNKQDLWHLAFVDISISEPYQMTLEGGRGLSYKSDIAIDDISLMPGSCNKRAFFLDCNFEDEKCNWLTDLKTSYIWTTSTEFMSKGDHTPDYDHTIKNDDGHYTYLKDLGSHQKECMKYKLTSTIINPGHDICFTFWYHMYEDSVGTLSVYTESGNTTQWHWSQSGQKGNSWKFANFTISLSKPYKIVFEGTRGDDCESGIALDDISLLDRSCSGLIKTSQSCHNIDETISLHDCSRYYLQLNETFLVFDPEVENCSVVYHDVQASINTLCNGITNSDICTFDLRELIEKQRRCFQSNRLLVEYKCEVSDKSVTLLASRKNESDSSTGFVVGMVIGGLLLACAVILIVVLIRRHSLKSKPGETIGINLRGNDYTGSQDIALPQTSKHSSHIEYFDKQTSIDAEYAIVDSTGETSFDGIKDDGNRTTDSYSILDPNETGFDRTACSNNPTANEFANSVKDTRNKIDDDGQYAISDGVYDRLGNNRHKESKDNIYNHAVDTIYDSGSQKRNNEGREDTYDHFFGQTTEDDYNISSMN